MTNGAPADEKPQHRVQITRPFYLGATEVTRGQFRPVRRGDRATRTEAETNGRGGGGWNAEANRFEGTQSEVQLVEPRAQEADRRASGLSK